MQTHKCKNCGKEIYYDTFRQKWMHPRTHPSGNRTATCKGQNVYRAEPEDIQ